MRETPLKLHWIPVSYSLPPESKDVLLWDGKDVTMGHYTVPKYREPCFWDHVWAVDREIGSILMWADPEELKPKRLEVVK